MGLSGLSILENCLFHVLPFKPDDKLKLVDAFAECRAKSRTSSDLSSFDTLVATCASEHVKFTETAGPIRVDYFPSCCAKHYAFLKTLLVNTDHDSDFAGVFKILHVTVLNILVNINQ